MFRLLTDPTQTEIKGNSDKNMLSSTCHVGNSVIAILWDDMFLDSPTIVYYVE